jgi:ferredoxin--NADP+ reductase
MMDLFQKKVQAENIIQLKFNCKEVLKEPCNLLISSVGFEVKPIAGLPMDERTGAVANVKGRVTGMPGVYVVGWAKRGPKGNIASNIPDATETANVIVEDLVKY